jgi:hypothetical protein
MKWRDETRVPVKVIRHLNGGFTQLLVLAGSQPFMTDVETERIPVPLRKICSRFFLVRRACVPEEHDTAESIRAALKESDTIEPLDAFWTDLFDQKPNWPLDN